MSPVPAQISMQANQRVRIRQNPKKVGILTGKNKTRGGRVSLQVIFPEDTEWVSERALEVTENNESLDVEDLLERGQFGKVRDLRGALTHSRLSGKLADLIYSMNTTNTDFYAYQYKPVYGSNLL